MLKNQVWKHAFAFEIGLKTEKIDSNGVISRFGNHLPIETVKLRSPKKNAQVLKKVSLITF